MNWHSLEIATWRIKARSRHSRFHAAAKHRCTALDRGEKLTASERMLRSITLDDNRASAAPVAAERFVMSLAITRLTCKINP